MKIKILCSVLVLIFCLLSGLAQAQMATFTREQVRRVGDNVFQRECAAKTECLLHWNEDEEFISVGIGHFIWYPAGTKGPYEESFPKLLDYLVYDGQKLPDWLNTEPYPECPWPTREAFLRERDGPRAQELYRFLAKTKYQQAEFIISRFNAFLPVMLQYVPSDKRVAVQERFARLFTSEKGLYAMIDYAHFKGFGTAPGEIYQGQGWGLWHVLAGMNAVESPEENLREFVRVGKDLLALRVRHSPVHRNEKKWLAGWHRRLDSYLE